MSLITDAAAAAVAAASTAFVAERRARLQAAFTDSAGKSLLDVSKLNAAHTDQPNGLLVLTDGTKFVAVAREEFRLVTRETDGTFAARGEFTDLLSLGLLLALT